MTADESLAAFGIVPKDEALPAIRALLAREAQLERQGHDREPDLALLCCVQLFASGHSEDILAIWDAKQAGMDLSVYLDVQFLCGMGLAEAKQYLASQSSEPAVAALAYLERCEAAGDFEGFTPGSYLANYREYFRVA